jgi:hypothetical protein
LTLDDLLPEPWAPEVLAALERWRQGHLLAVEKGVWLGPAGSDDPVTGDSLPGNQGELRARSATFGDTGYMAVISQTCDIGGGPGQRHPFVHACPVRDIAKFSPEKIRLIRDRQVNDYVSLTQPPVAEVEWAVDLRVTVPISKGVLAATEPVEGFATADDEIQLGHRVASKFIRPAVHDVLAGAVFDSLRKFLSRSKKTQTWCDDVEQLRLEILEGTALEPKRVRLHIYTDAVLSAADRKPLREEWRSHKKALKEAGIEQVPIRFVTLEKCSIKQYRTLIPIDVPTLDRGRFA